MRENIKLVNTGKISLETFEKRCLQNKNGLHYTLYLRDEVEENSVTCRANKTTVYPIPQQFPKKFS